MTDRDLVSEVSEIVRDFQGSLQADQNKNTNDRKRRKSGKKRENDK